MGISKLTSSAAIRSALKEFDKYGRESFLDKYGYGKSRAYVIRDIKTGKVYDSKPIIGVAYGIQYPSEGPLEFEAFSGGDASVVALLNTLNIPGLEILKVGEEWSREEVELTVADYFSMLALEARGTSYNKSEHNEALRARLMARSKASVEFKHQNISAALDDLKLPYVSGYKPRFNYQALLLEVVREYIERNGQTVLKIMDGFDAQTAPGARQFKGVVVKIPKVEPPRPKVFRERVPRKFDFAQREELNRILGHGGESWVVDYEKFRLGKEEMRPDLADRIDWVSDRLGDGVGYDILSLERNEASRFIEVKTTNANSTAPFIVTQNEIDFSEEVEDAFCLYRVYEYSTKPKLFVLRGSIPANLDLEPTNYRARLKAIAK